MQQRGLKFTKKCSSRLLLSIKCGKVFYNYSKHIYGVLIFLLISFVHISVIGQIDVFTIEQFRLEYPSPNTIEDIFKQNRLFAEIRNNARCNTGSISIDGYVKMVVTGRNGSARGLQFTNRIPMENFYTWEAESFRSYITETDWSDLLRQNLDNLNVFSLNNSFQTSCIGCNLGNLQLLNRGLLPEGDYSICIEVFGNFTCLMLNGTGTPRNSMMPRQLSETACDEFTVEAAFNTAIQIPEPVPITLDGFMAQSTYILQHDYQIENTPANIDQLFQEVQLTGLAGQAEGLIVTFPMFPCSTVVNSSNTIFTIEDIICQNNNNFLVQGNNAQTALIEQGSLPEGAYEICYRIGSSTEQVNATFLPFSESCEQFEVTLANLVDFSADLTAPLPNSVYDLFNLPNNLNISINHEVKNGLITKFDILIKGDNGLEVNAQTEEIQIEAGLNNYQSGVNLSELFGFDLGQSTFSNCINCPSTVAALWEKGLFAPGNYQLCLTPTSGFDFGETPLADPICLDFEVASGLIANLVLPPTLPSNILTAFEQIQIDINNQYSRDNEIKGIDNVFAQINFKGTSGDATGLEIQFPAELECGFDIPEQPQFLINLLEVFCGDGNTQNFSFIRGTNTQQATIQNGNWPGGEYKVCVELGFSNDDNTLNQLTELSCNSTTANNLFEFELSLNEPYPNNLADLFNSNGQLQLSTTNNLEEDLSANWNIEIIGQTNGLNINYNALLAQRPSSIPPQMNTYLSNGGLTDFLEKELAIADFSTCQSCTPKARYFIENGLFPAGDYQFCFQPFAPNEEELAARQCVSFSIEPQISTDLVVNEPFPLEVSALSNNTIINANVNNNYPVALMDIIPELYIRGTGGAATNLMVRYPEIACLDKIKTGIQNFTFDDLACSDASNYTIQGTTMQAQQLEEGTLPEGTYDICFDLINFVATENAGAGLPIVEQRCQTITVENPFTFSINTNPPFSNQISELFERPNFLQIQTENESATPIENIRFELLIEGQSGIAANLVLALQEPEGNASLVIPPGSTSFTGNRLSELFNDNSLATLIVNGQLNGVQSNWVESGYFPIGEYTVCVQAFRELGNQDQPIGALQCADFTVTEPIDFTFETNENTNGNIDNLGQENGLIQLEITNSDIIVAEDLQFNLTISGQGGDAAGLVIGLATDEFSSPSGTQIFTGNNLSNLLDLSPAALLASIQNGSDFQRQQIENGLLPEGSYKLCLTLARQLQNGTQTIDSEQCSDIEVMQPISLSLMANNSSISTLDNFFDNRPLIATIENGTGRAIPNIFYTLELEGVDGAATGLQFRAPRAPILGSVPQEMSEGVEMINTFGSLLGDDQFDQLQTTMVAFDGNNLPQGTYQVRLIANREIDGSLVVFRQSEREELVVSSLFDAPEITFISEKTIDDFDELITLNTQGEPLYLTLGWDLDLGNFTNDGITYELDFRKLPEGIKPSEIQLYRQPDIFTNAEILDNFLSTISVEGFFEYNSARDDRLQFQEGKIYAVRVQATSERLSFGSNGFSQVVLFRFGEGELDDPPVALAYISESDFAPVYPTEGVYLPFTKHPSVIHITQHKPSYRYFDFNHKIAQGEHYRSGWPNGGQGDEGDNYWPNGPLAFLKSYLRRNGRSQADINNIEEEQGYHFRVNQEAQTFERSAIPYTWEFDGTLEEEDKDPFMEFMYPVNYYIGMPPADLIYPENGETIPSGQQALKWHTGNPKGAIFPKYSTLQIHGTRNVGHDIFSEVQEKWVLQIAKDDGFLEIFHEEEGLITYKVSQEDIGTQNKYDASKIQAELFKNMETEEVDFTEGIYYWRVVYLKGPNSGLSNEESFYRSSMVGEFTVTDNNPLVAKTVIGGGGPYLEFDEGEDNTPNNPIASSGGESSDSTSTDCNTECILSELVGPAINDISNLSSIKVGHFLMTDLKVESSSGNTFTGKGIIEVDLLKKVKLKVGFANIQVNEKGEVFKGEVNAIKEDVDFNLADLGINLPGNDITDGVVNEADNFLGKNLDEGRIITRYFTGEALGLPLAIDREIEGVHVLLGFTEFKFSPTNATATILAEVKLPSDLYPGGGEKYFSLAASNICMLPSGFKDDFYLHLYKDIIIPDNSGKDLITIKGSDNSTDPKVIDSIATYVHIDCKGLKKMALRFEIDFPEDVVIPDERTPQGQLANVVKGTFSFELENKRDKDVLEKTLEEWGNRLNDINVIAEFDMTPFEFTALPGWGFTLEKGIVDYSTLDNPDDIVFPTGYEFANADDIPEDASAEDKEFMREIWTGFYLKELSVRVPDDLTVEEEEHIKTKLQVGLSNVIFNTTEGFTADIFASDILTLQDGDVNGWAFSVDTLKVGFLQNEFTYGKLAGGVRIPVQDTSSAIGYSAVLTGASEESGGEYGLTVNVAITDAPIKVPCLIGEVSLEKNSYINLEVGNVADGKGNAFHLNGEINIGGGLLSELDPTLAENMETTLNLKGMPFQLGWSEEKGWDQDFSKIGFASPQKFMGGDEKEGAGGFPITISGFSIEPSFSSGKIDSILGGNFKWTIGVNFMDTDDGDGGIAADATMNIDLGWDLENRNFVFNEFGVECISVNAEVKGVELAGMVRFYKDEPRCDEPKASGVKGILKVGLPVATVNLAAEFGSAGTGSNEYRFWYVDGQVVFNQGITMGTMALYGLGGGVYYNMSLKDDASNDSNGYNEKDMASAQANLHPDEDSPKGDSAEEDKPLPISCESEYQITGSNYKPCPQKGSTIFRAALVIGTAGDASVFNMDVSVIAEAKERHGLTQFTFIGDGYIMADFDERNTAPVKLDVAIGYEKLYNETAFNKAEEQELDYDYGFKMFADIEAYVDLAYPEDEPILHISGLNNKQAFDGEMRSQFVGMNFLVEELPEQDDIRWYFKMGSPKRKAAKDGMPATTGPGGLSLLFGLDKTNPILDAKLRMYLQAGNDIDAGEFMDLPELIVRLLGGTGPSTDGEGKSGSLVEGSGSDPFNGDRKLGGPPLNNDGRAEGFIMGLSFEAEADISAILLYAKLSAALGFDVSITNESGQFCIDPNDPTKQRPVGVNGWYTQGQMYAGIEGELGIQIDIGFWQERVKLLGLGAAFIIQGGFPNPTWAAGKAAVQYHVFGIEGQAGFSFSVGEKCIIPRDGAFGFATIDQVLPEDKQNNISPFTEIKTSFNLEMGEIIEIPVMTTDGEASYTERLEPFVAEYLLKGNGEAEGINYDFLEMWSHDNKLLTLEPSQPLKPHTQYTFYLKVQAKDQNKNDSIVMDPQDLSQQWYEDTTIVFTTGALPDAIPDNKLYYARPQKRQKYYLQDQGYTKGFTAFRINVSDYFYAKKVAYQNRGGNVYKHYKYLARFTPLDGSEPIETSLTYKNGYGPTSQFNFKTPELKNNTIYAINLVRRKAGLFQGQLPVLAPRVVDLGGDTQAADQFGRVNALDSVNENSKDIYNRADFISKAIELIPGEVEIDDQETIFFTYYFKTSQYNTIEEKLEGHETEMQNPSFRGSLGDIPIYLNIKTKEQFDGYDLFGVYDPLDAESYQATVGLPKIKPNFNLMETFQHQFDQLTYGKHIYNQAGLSNLFLTNWEETYDKKIRSKKTINVSSNYRLNWNYNGPLDGGVVAWFARETGIDDGKRYTDFKANGTITFPSDRPKAQATFQKKYEEHKNWSSFAGHSIDRRLPTMNLGEEMRRKSRNTKRGKDFLHYWQNKVSKVLPKFGFNALDYQVDKLTKIDINRTWKNTVENLANAKENDLASSNLGSVELPPIAILPTKGSEIGNSLPNISPRLYETRFVNHTNSHLYEDFKRIKKWYLDSYYYYLMKKCSAWIPESKIDRHNFNMFFKPDFLLQSIFKENTYYTTNTEIPIFYPSNNLNWGFPNGTYKYKVSYSTGLMDILYDFLQSGDNLPTDAYLEFIRKEPIIQLK